MKAMLKLTGKPSVSCLKRRPRSSLLCAWLCFHVGLSMTQFGVMHTALQPPLHRLAEAINYCSNGKLVMKECTGPPLSERRLVHFLSKTTKMQGYLMRNVRKSQDSTPIDESAAIDLAREVEVKMEESSACQRGRRRSSRACLVSVGLLPTTLLANSLRVP